MRVKIRDIGGEVVKDTDVYLLRDNKFLKNMILSSTTLHKFQSTRGHKHEGQEEIHRVHNNYDEDLYFVCVFDGKRNH
jgi:hypothetical protein